MKKITTKFFFRYSCQDLQHWKIRVSFSFGVQEVAFGCGRCFLRESRSAADVVDFCIALLN